MKFKVVTTKGSLLLKDFDSVKKYCQKNDYLEVVKLSSRTKVKREMIFA